MNIGLRPAAGADRAFVERVFFATQRWLIEALFDWRGDSIESAKFDEVYHEAGTQIITVDGEDAGWQTVHRDAQAISLQSIFLAPEHQRRGIGTYLIDALCDESRAKQIPLRLSTAKINPARNLYARLGFIVTGEDEYKISMEYR